MVSYRESWSHVDNSAGWNSDGILETDFIEEQDEVYVRFWIKFQPGWTPEGMSKIFRIRHWDKNGSRFDFFSDGDSCPIFLWDVGQNQYGLRNVFAFRFDPQETNYYGQENGGQIANKPDQQMLNNGISLNFQQHIRDLDGDGVDENPITLIDRTTGEVLDTHSPVSHEQVYGDGWNLIEFYIKMNSAPGVADGILKQWINNQVTFRNVDIPWMGSESPGGLGWNVASFGGNDNWNSYTNAEGVEEWYSIDTIRIYDGLPSNRTV